MPDSFEQQIVDHAIGLVGTILTTNGYETDIGATVEDSRPNWADDELPATSVFLGVAKVPDDASDNLRDCNRRVPLIIRVAYPRQDAAAANATYGRKAIQDLHKCLGTDLLFNGLLLELRPKSHGLEIEEGTYSISGAQAEFEAEYRAQKFDLTQR